MTPSPTTTVSGTPAPATAAAPPAAAGPTAADLAALKTENDALKVAAAEQERTAKFWYEKASKGGTPAPAAAAAPADDEDDLLDLITSKGAKGLDALLKKRGFVSATEVDAKVDAKASQIVSETQLLKDYPDLGNKDSEFFKATALFYGELKSQGVPERAAMSLAAEKAELAGIRAGTIKTPTQKTEEEKATRAADRAARAAAGAGDHGGRTATEEADETLTPEQRHIAIRLLGGNGVTDDQAIERYQKRAKLGVAMKSK